MTLDSLCVASRYFPRFFRQSPLTKSITIGVCLLLNGTTIPATAAAPTPHAIWEVGLAKSKITPTDPIMMGGFASRREPFRGVVHDLHVKAMAITDQHGHQALLITCDFIGFRAVNVDPICAEIMDRTGLARDQILLNSSHTHTGPSQAESPDKESYLDASLVRDLFYYTERLKKIVVETAVAATADASPAMLFHGTGVAPFVMNRREPSRRGIVLGHNPKGPADRSVPVLKITDLNGNITGVVFGTACHLTTIPPRDNQLCGDFAGFAQIDLEERHPGAQVMFMQGCGGDAGPYPTGSLELSEQHGLTLANEVDRVLDMKNLSTVSGPLATEYQKLELPLRGEMTIEQIKELEKGPAQWRRWVGSRMRIRHEEKQAWPDYYAAPFAVWQFGDSLTLVGLSGEVVVDYVARLSEELGPLDLWISGYCNDVFGYLPSARVLAEGGYETRGLYGGDAFSPQVEQVVVAGVKKLASKAGRELP